MKIKLNFAFLILSLISAPSLAIDTIVVRGVSLPSSHYHFLSGQGNSDSAIANMYGSSGYMMSHEAYVDRQRAQVCGQKAGQILQTYHSCKRKAANATELQQCEATKEASIQADLLACEGTSSVWN